MKTLTPDQIEALSAARINKALDALDKEQSKLMDDLIAAGLGRVRLQTIVTLDHPIAQKYAQSYAQRTLLQGEIERRYGPGAPRRLPEGRKFGPIKRS